MQRRRQTLDDGALDLIVRTLRVDHTAAIYCADDLVDRHVVVVHRDLGDLRHPRPLVVTRGNAAASALRQPRAPSRLRGGDLDDVSQPRRVKPEILAHLHILFIAYEREPECNRVDPLGVGELVDRARDDEDVARVLGGAPLSERDTRRHRNILKQEVRNEPGRELEVIDLRGRAVALEIDLAGVAHDLLVPVADAATLHRRPNPLHVGGTEIIVADVVFPAPDNLDRAPELPRQQYGVHDEVGVKASAESPSRAHHVNRDIVLRDA